MIRNNLMANVMARPIQLLPIAKGIHYWRYGQDLKAKET